MSQSVRVEPSVHRKMADVTDKQSRLVQLQPHHNIPAN